MSPQFRTGFYYFLQFWSGGAFHSYGGIWFASLGFTATQIGLANTIPTAIVLLSNIFVGKLADRAKDWRQVLVVLGIASAAAASGLIFAEGFYPVFVFWSAALIMQTLAVPVGDAAATFLAKTGRGSIGKMRALSTMGYIVSLFATGYAMQGLGGGIFATLFAGFSTLRALAALALPPFKAEANQPAPAQNGLQAFKSPGFALPLLGWAIVYATIQVLNSFLAFTLKKRGISETAIGLLIAWGALTEALVFYTFARFSHLLKLRTWVAISCAVSVLRWLVMAQSPSLWPLVLLQSLHGISYALGFVACVTYMAKHTSHTVAAEAQSAFNVIQMISAVIVVTAFGGLMENYGAKAFYASAAVAMIGTIFAVASHWFKPPGTTAPDQSA